MLNSTSFSIIIPTWNNLAYLQACIRSIQQNSAHPHEIIVHVNEGNDGTEAWLQSENIAYTVSKENIGICFAVNLSAALATKDYVLYINDDMYVLPNWDQQLLQEIEKLGDASFMLSATMIEPKDTGNPCVIHQNYGTDLQTFKEADLLEAYPTLYRANWNGSSWPPVLVRRTDWIKMGGFSSEFSPGMYSDPDLSMKLWNMGCRIFLGVGNSLVYHFQAKSTGRVTKNDGRAMFKQKWGISARFFYKHYLHMGTTYAGPISERIPAWLLKLEKLRNKL
jgi:GT2 family glycosyltransferase